MVEWLKVKALSSNPSITHTKKEKPGFIDGILRDDYSPSLS
jgi:hypothetical protein